LNAAEFVEVRHWYGVIDSKRGVAVVPPVDVAALKNFTACVSSRAYLRRILLRSPFPEPRCSIASAGKQVRISFPMRARTGAQKETKQGKNWKWMAAIAV
jgi:hypothetical protein